MKFLHRRRLKKRWLQEDIYAASVLINPLLNKMEQTAPFNQYSVRPFVLAILCNELEINQRANYLEFGGGVSTLLIAKFIKVNKLPTKIHLIESDKTWLDIILRKLKAEGLDDLVEPVHAPLKSYETAFGSLDWYDQDLLKEAIGGSKFDLVFVDGPPGKSSYHRYLAMPFVQNHDLLASSHSFYLDDANRKPELAIVNSWEKEYKLGFEFILERLAVYSSGDSFKVKLTNI